MRRRHVLALVILALVVATVLAMGPVRVWDWMTTKTVEEYWPNGRLHRHYRVTRWNPRPLSPEAFMDPWEYARLQEADYDYDEWYENGQKLIEIRRRYVPLERVRVWSETGHLRTHVVAGTGILSGNKLPTGLGAVANQTRYKDWEAIETRTSPPWFTDEEILQSVEGAEE